MKIENIIYDTTRGIVNLEDKLRISTIFIFCYKLNSKKFSQLLYTKNHKKFIEELNAEYEKYDVDLTVNFKDKNIEDAFYKTLIKVQEKYDDNGYYKALFEGDSFALVINEIVSYNFDAIEFKKSINGIEKQLSLF